MVRTHWARGVAGGRRGEARCNHLGTFPRGQARAIPRQEAKCRIHEMAGREVRAPHAMDTAHERACARRWRAGVRVQGSRARERRPIMGASACQYGLPYINPQVAGAHAPSVRPSTTRHQSDAHARPCMTIGGVCTLSAASPCFRSARDAKQLAACASPSPPITSRRTRATRFSSGMRTTTRVCVSGATTGRPGRKMAAAVLPLP